MPSQLVQPFDEEQMNAPLSRGHSPQAEGIIMASRKRGKNSDIDLMDRDDTRPSSQQNRSIVVLTGIFLLSVLIIYLLYISFPTLPAYVGEHRAKLKLPRTMEDAKVLGEVLEIYEQHYYYEVLFSFFFIYVFLQTFAIPGSIFLSILSGALFPFPVAMFAVCLCSALGATNCYWLSYFFGKGLVLRYFPDKLRQAQTHVQTHEEHLTYYIIFLRITPFLPNWFINIVCPLIDVGAGPFFIGTFIGVAPPSMVFIQAGQMLHDITHTNEVMSPRKLMLLVGMGFLSLAPILLKKKLARYF